MNEQDTTDDGFRHFVRNALQHIERTLERVERALAQLDYRSAFIMALLDDTLAKVTDIETVEGSIEALLADISQKLKDAGTDPVKIAELNARLDALKERMAAAVVANTPAA